MGHKRRTTILLKLKLMIANISEVQPFHVQGTHVWNIRFLCDLSHNINKMHFIHSEKKRNIIFDVNVVFILPLRI